MAAAPEKTAEELAKSVQHIEKLLAMHGASTADVKAKEKERKKMVAEEKLLQGRWGEVLDEQKKQLGEETQTFKHMGSFIGNETKKYFAMTEKNQITWGGLATSVKDGVKNWFAAASKQRTALGATLRLGATLWENAHKHIIQNVQKLWGAVTGQISEVLGELGGVLGWVKDSFVSVFKFMKDSFMGFFAKVPPADRRRNKLLQALVGFARRDEKRDLLGSGSDGKDGWGMLGALALIAAGVLGAFIGKILLPFKLIAKAFKLGPAFVAIKKFFMGFEFMAKFFKNLQKPFRFMRKIFVIAKKMFPFFRKAVGIFKWGFTKLAWPIQIIMSIFDFIDGFMKTEGNLADKVIAGVKNVFLKFLDLPVRLIGWVVEKVLGLFGVKTEGVADKIMGWIGKIIELFTAFWRPLIGFFEGFFSTEGSFIDKIKGGLGGFFEGMQDMLKVFDPIIAWLKPLTDWVKSAFGDFFKGITIMLEVLKPFTDKVSSIISGIKGFFGGGKKEADPKKIPVPTGTPQTSSMPQPLKNVVNAEAKKRQAEASAQTEEVVTALNKNTEKQIDAEKKIAKESTDASALAMGGNSMSPPAETPANPLQDEVDIYQFLGGNNNF